jgi:hypothetical protein
LINHHTRKAYKVAEVLIYTFITSPEIEARGKLHTLTASFFEKNPPPVAH